MFKAKCMYCGSKAVGWGCAYGPKGTHVHPHNAGNCIYCGSQSIGMGCPYNPAGKNHVHGVDYNLMLKEGLLNGMTAGLLMKRLSQPYNEWPAFKSGIINENGQIIKKPSSIEEKSSFTAADAYIIKLRKLLSSNEIELLNNSIYLSEQKNNINDAKTIEEMYSKQYDTKNEIKKIIEQLLTVISSAHQSGLNMSDIEKVIIETISTSN